MTKLVVLVFLPLLAMKANCQPLQEQDEVDDLKGQTSSLTSSSSSSSLRRAVITFEPESIVPLEFKNRARRKPKGRHLKQARLLRKMGADFDPAWMSTSKPPSSQLRGETVEMGETQLAELVSQVAELDLDRELKELDGSEDDDEDDDVDNFITQDFDEEEIRTKMIGLFQEWLIQKSSCPVSYTWLDLGDLFWPRWVKKGHCESSLEIARQDDNNDGNSFDCSWPRGMKCVAGKSKVLHILRWHCRLRRPNGKNANGKSRHKCRWYKVPYPVTESCMCGSN